MVGIIRCIVDSLVIGLNASGVIAWFRKDEIEDMQIGIKALGSTCNALNGIFNESGF